MTELMHDVADTGNAPIPGELASPPRRFFGQFLDALLVYVGFFIALALDSSALLIVAWGLAVVYILLADGLPGGQSLGKRLLHMRVVDERSGQPCTYGKSLLRNILLAILGPIDWVFIFGKKHQRLGDKAAGTIVVMV